MTRRPLKTALTTALTALLAMALTACGGGYTPSEPAAPGPHPGVTPRQAVGILNAVDAAVVRATTARDPKLLAGRAVGPAAQEIGATIKVQAALKQSPTAPPAPTKPRLLLTSAGPWPRWFAAAGTTPASPTPVLRVLQSADARTPYGLWGQLSLLPGAVLPDVAPATSGAPALAIDATGLVRTPGDVVGHYADLLNRGDASRYAAEFAPDTYRSRLAEQLKQYRAAFAQAGAGQVTTKHDVAAGNPFVMPTLDGGAIVIVCINQTTSVAVAAGRGQVRLDAELAPLAGRSMVTQNLQELSLELLAFYVPKAGSTAKVTLLAASRADVAATGT